MSPIPAELTHRCYCAPCFNDKVGPALDAYNQNVRKAKAVFIFTKFKGEQTRLMKRNEKPIQVEGCLDERDTLLRLAFLAVKVGCNAVIDVDIRAKKLRNEGYQTIRWQASGIPTKVDADKLNRQ